MIEWRGACSSLSKLKVSTALTSIQDSAWSLKWSCHSGWCLPAFTTGLLSTSGTRCNLHLSGFISFVNLDSTVYLTSSLFCFFCFFFKLKFFYLRFIHLGNCDLQFKVSSTDLLAILHLGWTYCHWEFN